jgi:hypothetical protein
MVFETGANAQAMTLSNLGLRPGMYMVEIALNGGLARNKVVVQ